MKDDVKKVMMSEYEIKELGLMYYILSMEVHQLEDEIVICQISMPMICGRNIGWTYTSLFPLPLLMVRHHARMMELIELDI